MENSNTVLANYQNGGYTVTLLSDGTKYFNGDLNTPSYPDSLDVKITDCCKNDCKFCYMNASPKGNHCDLNALKDYIKDLPRGTELAIGGGNILEYPGIKNSLKELKNFGFITNITLNSRDFKGILELSDVVYGIGISVSPSEINSMPNNIGNNNIVIHFILGINTYDDLLSLYKKGYKKFLLLGFKNIGRGNIYHKNQENYINKNIQSWKKTLPKILRDHSNLVDYPKDITVSFDNLAIEQVGLKNILLKSEWDSIYNGKEFSHTMYLDAVNQKVGPSSFSPISELVNWSDIDLITYFRNNHDKALY